MALFKRAQVSVLLGEPDQAARIDAARRRADATTRDLIERERLFQAPAARQAAPAERPGGSPRRAFAASGVRQNCRRTASCSLSGV